MDDLMLNELELEPEEWETLTEWARYEKIRELFSVESQSVWAANSRVSDLEEALQDAQEELEQAENNCAAIRPVYQKLRQNLLIDPCPGQLPIEFPKPKQRTKKRKAS